MSTSDASANEIRRLQTLREYGVLDTPPEPALDELTVLAAAICETPIAFISLVDEHRQWFKSKVGLDVAETPREVSFCTYTIRQAELLIVPDTMADPRFANHPVVTGAPGIRFYAGAPLVAPGGEVLGALCVKDVVPRTLSPSQQQALRVLSRQVMMHFELHRQAREMAARERLLRAIFEAEPECVKVLGEDGTVQMMNRAGLQIVEAATFEEIAGICIFPLIAAEHRAQFEALTARVFRGESATLEFRGTGLKGTPRWLETHAAPLRNESGAVTGLLGITRDITARKEAEEALRASEERHRATVDSSLDAILTMDAEGRITEFNPAAERIFGHARNAVIGRMMAEVIIPAHLRARHAQGMARYLATRETVILNKHIELSALRGDGTEFPVELSITRIGQVEPPQFTGIIRDITARKQGEEALRAGEARYRALFEYAPDGIVIANAESYYLDANASALRMLGYTRDEFIGLHARDIVSQTEIPYIEPALNTIESGIDYNREWEFRRKDDSVFTAEVLATKMPDGNLLAMIHDVTERKRLEQQFLRAQRMESIGTLASGVAHDLNNILSPIMMSVHVLRREMNPEQREEIISTIEASAERGAQIIKQVLAFGRGLEGEKSLVQPAALIREMMKIMHGTFPKNISCESSVESEPWLLLGDSTQLHQVLLNLCVNARDAMPNGGRLRIAARNLDVDSSYASMVPEAKPGPHVLIEVTDTGGGMLPEVVERIFDPFFTTKGIGKGTGLGLSTALGIVRSHGGCIVVNSIPGTGTTFQVYLPASLENDVQPTAASRVQSPEGHGELILVVDDEASVRNAVRISLEAAGYRVLLAADGTEALAVFVMNSDIAAVLTDLMMPHMDGVKLIRALRTLAPDLPMMASTGLGEKVQLAELKALNVATVLNKPYTSETLLQIIHEELYPGGGAPANKPQ
jgi:two-component system, cell cycle sensor histidine kinase and response regulator CckA